MVGIVYAAPAQRAQAEAVAENLRAIAAPNSLKLETVAIAAAELQPYSGRIDALFVLPGLAAEAGVIGQAVRERRLVSISNDPTCLDSQCCVLMVRAAQSVEIVLNTELADAANARFSSVFAMMVQRR